MRLRSSSAPIDAQAGEPAGVVDGHAERLDEAVQQLDVLRCRSGWRRRTRRRSGRSGRRATAASSRGPTRRGARGRGRPRRPGRARCTVPRASSGPLRAARAASRRRASAGRGCPCVAPAPRSRRTPRRGSTVTLSNSTRSRRRVMEESSTSSRSSDAGSVWATRCSENSRRVGLGQAAEPVEGERLLAGRLPRHLAGHAAGDGARTR